MKRAAEKSNDKIRQYLHPDECIWHSNFFALNSTASGITWLEVACCVAEVLHDDLINILYNAFYDLQTHFAVKLMGPEGLDAKCKKLNMLAIVTILRWCRDQSPDDSREALMRVPNSLRPYDMMASASGTAFSVSGGDRSFIFRELDNIGKTSFAPNCHPIVELTFDRCTDNYIWHWHFYTMDVYGNLDLDGRGLTPKYKVFTRPSPIPDLRPIIQRYLMQYYFQLKENKVFFDEHLRWYKNGMFERLDKETIPNAIKILDREGY